MSTSSTAGTPAASARSSRGATGDGRFGAFDAILYAVTVFGWSTSWIAVKGQVGVVAPEVSLLWRFLISATLMWVWVILRRDRLKWPARIQIRFAALGILLFSTNFTLFYYAARALPSGLLSVVFSLTSVINLVFGFVLFGQRITGRVFLGGVLGFAGVAAMFWPRIAGTDFSTEASWGLGLAVAGTISFCAGNMVSSRIQRLGVPVLVATAWGMTWACGFLAAVALARGEAFTIEPTLAYGASLVWLAVVASVAAFWGYLTLLGRIGAARAGYSTVMFPVFALAISTVFENYQWTISAIVGLVLVLSGNLFVLRK